MKKKTLAALLALTMALACASCGNTESAEKEEKAETTTTAATTTAAEKAEPEEDSSSEEEAEEEESSESEESKDKDKNDESSEEKKEDKKEEKKKEDKKDDKKDEEKSESDGGYSNDVYSVSFDTKKWVDAESFKNLIVEQADKTEILKQMDLNQLLDGIYYYADDADSDYPSNILFITPMYQAEMRNVSITDTGMADLMFQTVEAQMQQQEGISITDHKLVNKGGQDWLFIQTHAEMGSMVYNCDEYVTFYNGNSLIISVNYGSPDGAAKKEFDKMLENIKFKS